MATGRPAPTPEDEEPFGRAGRQRQADRAERPERADQGEHADHGRRHRDDDDHGHGVDELRPVERVRQGILERIRPLSSIVLPLQEAFGCVLAEDVEAEGDIPPFASSAMDGFAVRAADVGEASLAEPATLRIAGRVLIGQPPDVTVGGGEAVRIATGAPVPAGADCIVPVEHALTEGEVVHILRSFPEGASIRPAGQDVMAGQTLVPQGRRLAAPELGMLSTSGHASVPVYPRPRVVVLSTGDELVDPGRPASFGKIPDSNSYTMYGALREVGAVPYLAGIIPDDPDRLKDEVLGLAARADCFISSGGVSVGERDVVKKAFFRRGEIEFYRVAMQPGMPQAFGFVDDVPYFGLPGNPVSVFVSFEVFVRPAVLKMMGRTDVFRPEIWAVLDSEIVGSREKLVFSRVRVWRERGQWKAASTGPSGSNLLGTVTRANGLAMIPVGSGRSEAGSRVRVMLFRALEEER
jgi:molybdopterin molybdotransferase